MLNVNSLFMKVNIMKNQMGFAFKYLSISIMWELCLMFSENNNKKRVQIRSSYLNTRTLKQ